MIDGTEVFEITESLPNGDIIRLVGNGWKPRTIYLEIITGSTIPYDLNVTKIKIDDKQSMKMLASKITEFLEHEEE